jgi:pilus assembly protein CpaB
MFKIEKRPQIGIDARTLRDIEQVQGYYARTLLLPGQPTHLDSITKVKPTSAISTKIPPGFRAVTIRTDATSSVEGWARPGSRVDVNWISKINGRQGVTTIVHNAEILSANRQAVVNPNNPNAPVPTTVTLLVSAKDAKSIKLAQPTGSLELVLRGDSDTGKVEEGGSITVDDLLHGSRTAIQRSKPTGGTLVMGGKKYLVAEDGSLVAMGGDE